MMRHMMICLTVFWCGAALMTGCSRSPQVTFYTLEPLAQAGTAVPAQGAPAVSIVSLTLPDLIDRPQLVERVNSNRAEIHESHRWAEPLKSGIPRLLAENLARLLGSDRVSVYPQSAGNSADYLVSVDIRRFETMGKVVSVDLLWSVRRTPDGAAKTGRSQVHETRGGEGYEALVSAYNRALVTVSSDIAKVILSEWSAAR